LEIIQEDIQPGTDFLEQAQQFSPPQSKGRKKNVTAQQVLFFTIKEMNN